VRERLLEEGRAGEAVAEPPFEGFALRQGPG
jgi:hypothetical protein